MEPTCCFCERKEGAMNMRFEPLRDEDTMPLGPVEKCPECGRMSCPDCQHERDCCAMVSNSSPEAPKKGSEE